MQQYQILLIISLIIIQQQIGILNVNKIDDHIVLMLHDDKD